MLRIVNLHDLASSSLSSTAKTRLDVVAEIGHARDSQFAKVEHTLADRCHTMFGQFLYRGSDSSHQHLEVHIV